MQRINEITARIQSIQARVERPSFDGAFQSMLNRRLDAGAASHTHGAQAAQGSSRRYGALALDGAALSGLQSMTLGAMMNGGQVGGTAPTYGGFAAHHVPDGAVSTAAELNHYMAVNRIEARNGRLGSHELTPISGSWHGNGKLLPPAAEAWELMRAAAAADGIDLKAIDTYRSWESQDHAHKAHQRGEKKANVLPPGTSRHGAGLAVDITNGSIIDRSDREWQWLQVNGPSFGWHPISNEAWHWEFRGV